MVNIVVQAGGASSSETHPHKTLTLRNAEGRKQDVTSDTYIYISPSGDSSSESTLVNTPTEALLPLRLQQEVGEEAHASGEQRRSEAAEAQNTRPLLGPNNGGNDGLFEAVGKVPQGTGEQVGAEQTGPMVQECLLRSEEAAHRETRSELARLEAWCDAMHDENAMLQTQLQTADEKAKKMRKELGAAEDEATNLQTQLSDAENNIRGFKLCLPELQRKMVERERQLGIDVYSRLQDVGRLISPHDRVWAEYKDLMNAMAQRFSIPPIASDENMNFYDDSRFEELGEVEDGDGKERAQNESGAPRFNADMMGDDTMTDEEDAIQAEGYGTASDDDDDDDISRHGRPMRPGTASRLSMSFFTAKSEERPGQPSFSHLEGPQEVQEECEPALPTPSTSHLYQKATVDLEEELESSSGFKFTGSNLEATSEEADLSQATGEIEGAEGSIPQPEASQPIFSISFDFAGETSRDEGSRRRNNRNDGRGNQNPSRNKSRLPTMSELAYDPAIFEFSRQSQPEESVPSSSSGVTENGDSEPLEAGNESGSQTQGASDVIGDATAAVIDPSLEAQYNLLIQSTNTVAELREARDGKTRMTDSEPEDAPSENIPRATWAPFPWVEVEEEIKKSPAELMKELPFDWMLPTPPRIRPSDGQNRTGESSRSRYSSAFLDGMHIANMKNWIDSIAPLEKGFNAAKTLKIQPSRATPKAHDSKNAEERTPDAMPLSEHQTEEAGCTADGQTQEMKSSSGTQTTQAPQMDRPSLDEELLSLINGIQKLSLGPSSDAAGQVEEDNKSDQEHTENLENLINGIRDLSLGPSVNEAGRYTEESRVQLSGDWNVSGRGQYSPKDLDKGSIFGRLLGRKAEVRDPGFTAKKEQIAAPEEEITKEIDHKCKKAQTVVKPSDERGTRPADAERQEQHETTSPFPVSEQQSTINNPRTTPHPKQPKKQNVTTNQPAVTASTTETTPENAIPSQPLEPRPAIPRNDQSPPPQTEGTYVSEYSLQGLSYPDAAPKTKYRDPFSLRRDKK